MWRFPDLALFSLLQSEVKRVSEQGLVAVGRAVGAEALETEVVRPVVLETVAAVLDLADDLLQLDGRLDVERHVEDGVAIRARINVCSAR